MPDALTDAAIPEANEDYNALYQDTKAMSRDVRILASASSTDDIEDRTLEDGTVVVRGVREVQAQVEDVARALATVETVAQTVVAIGQTAPTNARQTGTFTSWRFPIGPVTEDTAGGFEITVPAWDPAKPVANARLLLWTDGYSDSGGVEVADVTLALESPISTPQAVTFDFPAPLAFTGETLFGALITDGHCGHRWGSPLTQTAALRGRWQFRAATTTLNDTGWVAVSSDQALDMTCRLIRYVDDVTYEDRLTAHIDERAAAVLDAPSVGTSHLLLPRRLYAMEGAAVALYHDAITMPTASGARAEVAVERTRGRNLDHGWWWIHADDPALDGTVPITVVARQGAIELARVAVPVQAFPATRGAGVTRRVLVPGDSTTADGAAINEAGALLEGQAGLQVEWVGTQGAGPRYHEGYSGQTLSWHFQDPAAPMVYGGVFDFGAYLADHSIVMEAGDWFVPHLGINDIFGLLTDAAVEAAIATALAQMDAIIADVQAAVPGIRVGICTMLPPSRRPNAFGVVYQSSQTLPRYARNRALWVEAMLTRYDTAVQEAAGVHVVPYGEMVDPLWGFPAGEVSIHPYNPETALLGTDALHPNGHGKRQMGSALASFLKYWQ